MHRAPQESPAPRRSRGFRARPSPARPASPRPRATTARVTPPSTAGRRATKRVADVLRDDGSEPAAAVRRALAGAPAGRPAHHRASRRREARGIDFRPATGDLYSVGGDNVVYRVNPSTGSRSRRARRSHRRSTASPSASTSTRRSTRSAYQRRRSEHSPQPGRGHRLSADPDLNPGDPNVVGSAYTESSFNATRPATTVLYAVDPAATCSSSRTPRTPARWSTGSRWVSTSALTGFDIAGAGNVAYLVATPAGRSGAVLYRVDLTTGKASFAGRVGRGDLAVTGLAAWQD